MTTAKLPELLGTLRDAIDSASEALREPEKSSPPEHGISLLDAKNELMLAYLQNLVFLIVLKIRAFKTGQLHALGKKRANGIGQDEHLANGRSEGGDLSADFEATVEKLVELRVYLDKGVKPLENRLRYQIDKVLRAADDAALKEATQKLEIRSKEPNNSESASDVDIDPLSFRPNPAALLPVAGSEPLTTPAKSAAAASSGGAYRPPRLNPVLPPSSVHPRSLDADPNSRRERPNKSATLDEFVAQELSAAPLAEPSVGSNVLAGGRRTKTAREREEERERTAYEEANFVRLPKDSGKKTKQRKERDGGGWGGEEWRDLGRGADRVGDMVKRRKQGSGLAERGKKRARERDSGLNASSSIRPVVSERFERKRQRLESRLKRRKA